MRVLCISGFSGTGKTSFLVRLVGALDLAPERVGILKHAHHSVGWHPPGTDSGRLAELSPRALVVQDPAGAAIFRRDAAAEGFPEEEDARDPAAVSEADREASDRDLARARELLPEEVALALAEGYARSSAPKVWIGLRAADRELRWLRDHVQGVRAVATTPDLLPAWSELDPPWPVFDRNDAAGVAQHAVEWAGEV